VPEVPGADAHGLAHGLLEVGRGAEAALDAGARDLERVTARYWVELVEGVGGHPVGERERLEVDAPGPVDGDLHQGRAHFQIDQFEVFSAEQRLEHVKDCIGHCTLLSSFDLLLAPSVRPVVSRPSAGDLPAIWHLWGQTTKRGRRPTL
jgi:hypothetical protein